MIVRIISALFFTGVLCYADSPVTLVASPDKQILCFPCDQENVITTPGDTSIVWLIRPPSHYSTVVAQILNLELDPDGEDFLELRECGTQDDCPDTCDEDFNPEEEETDCHQWCDEAGPEEEFETSDSCIRVELFVVGELIGRGFILAYWVKPTEETDCHQWCDEAGPEEEFETSDSCIRVELFVVGELIGRGFILAYWVKPTEVHVVGRAKMTAVNNTLFIAFGGIILTMAVSLTLILVKRIVRLRRKLLNPKCRIIIVKQADVESSL